LVSSQTTQPTKHILFPYTTLFRSLHRAIASRRHGRRCSFPRCNRQRLFSPATSLGEIAAVIRSNGLHSTGTRPEHDRARTLHPGDRKSTRLNSSHVSISYAVFCLK